VVFQVRFGGSDYPGWRYHRNPPRLVFAEHFRCRPSPRLVLVINIRKPLTVLVADNKNQPMLVTDQGGDKRRVGIYLSGSTPRVAPDLRVPCIEPEATGATGV
jgi:hypothetical protein